MARTPAPSLALRADDDEGSWPVRGPPRRLAAEVPGGELRAASAFLGASRHRACGRRESAGLAVSGTESAGWSSRSGDRARWLSSWHGQAPIPVAPTRPASSPDWARWSPDCTAARCAAEGRACTAGQTARGLRRVHEKPCGDGPCRMRVSAEGPCLSRHYRASTRPACPVCLRPSSVPVVSVSVRAAPSRRRSVGNASGIGGRRSGRPRESHGVGCGR